MAQAARLSLRLQKELKLLLSDPPPGAAFPHLSSSSLSSIVAQIQGPEETAYAGGIFTVKIEIPDRYPFQPPCVTFATPIYHPNIDTGGRICLDILNLPPKGAWQPSLNISTVITSIGLLLSEPNPDDGLMCDASREYKYNRREFDRKAREMTEKYAKAAAVSESSVSDAEFQSLASPNALERGPEVDTTGHESKFQATESVVAVKEVDVRLEVKTFSDGSKHDAIPPVTSHKKLIGKLSLESSVPSCERDAHIKRWEVPEDKMEVDETEKLLNDSGSSKCNLSQEKLCGSRRKLSLGALSQSQEKSDNNIKKIDQYPSVELQNLSVPNSGSLMPRSDNSCKQGRHRSQDNILPEDNINFGSKKPRHVGNKQILGSLSRSEVVNENKDEIVFSPQLPPSHSHTNLLHKPLHAPPTLGSVKNTHMIDGVGNASSDTSLKRLCLTGKKLSLGLRGSSQIQEKDDKENVAPRMSEYNGLGSKNADENATHKKLGIAQSEENNSNMRPSKSLPNYHQHFRAAEKHPPNYIDIITKTTNQKKADEPSGHESESVIVLDSEDSDEEKTTRVKSKPVLARKRLGRWRVRT